jgi:hypothetical protein
MAVVEEVDDLSVAYEEGGQVLVEELDKCILSKGAWATVLFKFREANRSTGEMGKIKYTIRRYQKRNGVYRQQSKFNISSPEQARKILDALGAWLDDDEQA